METSELYKAAAVELDVSDALAALREVSKVSDVAAMYVLLALLKMMVRVVGAYVEASCEVAPSLVPPFEGLELAAAELTEYCVKAGSGDAEMVIVGLRTLGEGGVPELVSVVNRLVKVRPVRAIGVPELMMTIGGSDGKSVNLEIEDAMVEPSPVVLSPVEVLGAERTVLAEAEVALAVGL